MRARLKVEGVSEHVVELGRIGDRARRPEPALRARQTREDLQDASRKRFRRGLRRASRAWILEKQRRGLSTRTMHATGAAMLALTNNSGPARGAVTFNAFNAELRWGVKRGRSDLFYIQVHAGGYTTKKGRQAPRRVVVIDKPARESIAERVVTYVHTGRL